MSSFGKPFLLLLVVAPSRAEKNVSIIPPTSASPRFSMVTMLNSLIAFDVRGAHTVRVASFWMLCNFRVGAPSWTGWPLATISCESFESRWILRVDSFQSGCDAISGFGRHLGLADHSPRFHARTSSPCTRDRTTLFSSMISASSEVCLEN